jgi:hypothetical protein
LEGLEQVLHRLSRTALNLPQLAWVDFSPVVATLGGDAASDPRIGLLFRRLDPSPAPTAQRGNRHEEPEGRLREDRQVSGLCPKVRGKIQMKVLADDKPQ